MQHTAVNTHSRRHDAWNSWQAWVFYTINGSKHMQTLSLYLVVVAIHFMEHVVQVGQVYLLGWAPKQAGGVLGLWFPGLAMAEVLHLSFNYLQLMGLILLLPGMRGRARSWWIVALIAQSWHFAEHMLLQVQFLTGIYLFNYVKQTSLLEWFFPRIELHFGYNLMVFIPTVIAVALYVRQRSSSKNVEIQRD